MKPRRLEIVLLRTCLAKARDLIVKSRRLDIVLLIVKLRRLEIVLLKYVDNEG